MVDKEISNVSLKEFVLVKGDITGIQEFIFNVRSKKAANSIKGRSFFIKVLTEISIQYFFDKFNVIVSDRDKFKVSTSGGNFILILPNVANAEELIQNAQKEFSLSLRFTGINIALNYTYLIENEYSKCLIKLNSNVRKNKLRLYGNINQTEFDSVFAAQSKVDFDKNDKNENWTIITNAIRNQNYFSIEKKGSFDLIVKNNSIELVGFTCLFHNNIELDQSDIKDFLESLFPLDKIHILDFEDLSEKGDGVHKLGILKMDVDNLGTTLERITSIQEHKEFDNELRDFFNKNLSSVINDNFKNQIYPVTAGGDDSFFVGNWRTILDLAIKIQGEFSKYQYFQDRGLTISAGYIIVNPKFPVVRFSQLADDALHKAKYKFDKGNICIFNEVVSWEQLNEIMGFKKNLNKGVTDKSKGLLAKSRQAAIRGIDENKVILKDSWEMSYFLRDCPNVGLVEEIRNHIKNFLTKSKDSIDKKDKRAYRLILPIAARILELEKR